MDDQKGKNVEMFDPVGRVNHEAAAAMHEGVEESVYHETQGGEFDDAAFNDACRKRTAARGWVTRASKHLDLLLGSGQFDAVSLSDAIDTYDRRLAALESAQRDVEVEIFDEAHLLSDIETADFFLESSKLVRIAGTRHLQALLNPPKSNAGDHSESVVGESCSGTHRKAALPKLVLPTFEGDIMQWPSFWDQFNAIVHISDMPEVSKFAYLQSVLKGEAASVIKGLSLTADHYVLARGMLESRFGRKEKLIFAHIQDLMSLQLPSGNQKAKVAALWVLQDKLLANVRSLEKLGVDGKQYGVILTPLILSRMPSDLRMEWAREGEGKESDLEFLLQFLNSEIQRQERSQAFSQNSAQSTGGGGDKALPRVPTAAALHTASQKSQQQRSSSGFECTLCGKQGHTTDRCYVWRKLSLEDRRSKVRELDSCFKCLGQGHIAKGCKSRCSQCSGNHHQILCNGKVIKSEPKEKTPLKSTQQPQQKSGAGVSLCSGQVNHGKASVLLQIARVPIRSAHGDQYANVLFDTGSDRTYVSSKFIQKVNPECVGSEPISYVAFGAGKPGGTNIRNLFTLHMKCLDSTYRSITATEVPVICAPLFRPKVPAATLRAFDGLTLAAAHDSDPDGSVTIDILIGLDVYWSIMMSSVVANQGLVAQETVFGWVLSGLLGEANPGDTHIPAMSLLCFKVSESALHRFWDLESIGITDEDDVSSGDRALKDFADNVVKSGDRYEVGLLWKPGKKEQLMNNVGIAHKQLQSTSRKLAKDEDLLQGYNSYFQEMEAQGMIVEVKPDELTSDNPVFYLPHRPVVKKDSRTTKIRPVFNASAPGVNGVSLNDCLDSGPNLLPDLVAILVRFRRWLVGVSGDIQKAFLQVQVRRCDQDVHRFLWEYEGGVRVMRITRLPFGNTCSPFLLNAVLRHHLQQKELTPTLQELLQNLYVDDFLSGDDSDQGACGLVTESSDVMGDAGCTFGKWCSSSPVVAEMLTREFEDKNLSTESSVKVLGMKWIAALDCFAFAAIPVPDGLCVTKRVVLSFIARLYDPLGFATPFVTTLKCLFQELWKLGLDWEVVLPDEFQSRFMVWVHGLQVLETWRIPRSYTGLAWNEITHITLHGFGDASEKAYGCCVYIVCEYSDARKVSSLVLSRARVAPVKRVTLPRLELLAALLCARLVKYVLKALMLPQSTEIHCWTDSQVTLAWIKGDPDRWKPFVANRVSQIQELTSPTIWSFCPGVENPADLVTRGLRAEELVASVTWLKGPAFLCENSSLQEFVESDFHMADHDMECRSVPPTVSLVATESLHSETLPVYRWSSLGKSIRVVAWIYRFFHNARHGDRRKGELTLDELSSAKQVLLVAVQHDEYAAEIEVLLKGEVVSKQSPLHKLRPFIDDEGLLRVGGRLQFSELTYSEKHPIVIPKSHAALLLIRYHHVLMKHAGVVALVSAVRRHYWVFGLRRLAKRVKRECVSCQKLDKAQCNQPMAPLPGDRVSRAPAFSVSGIDHAGPLFCLDRPGQKFYVLLITCAVVRAVHLELVDSLNVFDTVLALRRFFSRRGLPSTIYSDNAKTFQAAQGKLISLFGHLAPRWKFIAPRSPWWGGWWERLVKSVKVGLKKSIGSRALERSELETVLHEVESCVNSRPLTFVGDEVDARSPLTPAHFLTERPAGVPGDEVNTSRTEITAQELLAHKQVRNELLEYFWQVWLNEYLRDLPQVYLGPGRGAGGKCEVGVGSVVLVREDGQPRLNWPVAVVTRIFPGRDGLVRSVEVRTSRGTFIRSVQRLHDLEVSSQPSQGDVSLNESRATDGVALGSGEVEGETKDNSSVIAASDLDTTQGSPSRLNDSHSVVKVTSKGRRVKPRVILDL